MRPMLDFLAYIGARARCFFLKVHTWGDAEYYDRIYLQDHGAFLDDFIFSSDLLPNGKCLVCGKPCSHEFQGCKCVLCGFNRGEGHTSDLFCRRCGRPNLACWDRLEAADLLGFLEKADTFSPGKKIEVTRYAPGMPGIGGHTFSETSYDDPELIRSYRGERVLAWMTLIRRFVGNERIVFRETELNQALELGVDKNPNHRSLAGFMELFERLPENNRLGALRVELRRRMRYLRDRTVDDPIKRIAVMLEDAKARR